MLRLTGRQFAFVVRISVHPASGDHANVPPMRGSVQLLGTPPVRYFRDWEALSRLLQEAIDQTDPPPGASDEELSRS